MIKQYYSPIDEATHYLISVPKTEGDDLKHELAFCGQQKAIDDLVCFSYVSKQRAEKIL